MGQVLRSLFAEEAKMEKKVPGTLCLRFLSLSSRNTLHTDRVHQSILGVSTLLNAQVLSRVNAQQIKTRKLLLVGMWRSSVEDSS